MRPAIPKILHIVSVVVATTTLAFAQFSAQASGKEAAPVTVNDRADVKNAQQWELVHEVDIVLPREKRVYGHVEVMLDRNSVKIKDHEVYYQARIYRKSETGASETIERRISDCRLGRYKVESITNLRTGVISTPSKITWRKPRQAHVLKLEQYMCETVCGMGYPKSGKRAGASCLAR